MSSSLEQDPMYQLENTVCNVEGSENAGIIKTTRNAYTNNCNQLTFATLDGNCNKDLHRSGNQFHEGNAPQIKTRKSLRVQFSVDVK